MVFNPGMITQRDMDGLENRFREVFATKDEFQQLKNDLMNKLDSILKEILASREEETILSHRVSNHEDRVTALETVKVR